MSDPWDEFDPSADARNTLRWAYENGASTLGEPYGVRGELDTGLELLGPDTPLTDLL